MNIAFTICSNNYFAQAKILIDTFLHHNPTYQFVIGLVDKKIDLIDYHYDSRISLTTIEDLNIPEKYNILHKYNIVELNTCVKASYIKYIFNNFEAVENIFYCDPDTAIFQSFEPLEKELRSAQILLTPHIITPIKIDDFEPKESLFLKYGIYNLGFIGINFSNKEIFQFLDWWEERTLNFGFNRPEEGLFVDQLPMNFTAVFVKETKVSHHLGINMGPWNLHERQLSFSDGKYLVNDYFDLILYHFSSYSYKQPDTIGTKSYTRYNFENCKGLRPLYTWYQTKLVENNVAEISLLKCVYRKNPGLITVIKKHTYVLLHKILFKLLGDKEYKY